MKEAVQKLADRALLYSLPVAILGAAFKTMHWPYANQMLLVGLSSVGLAAFLRYASEKTIEGYVTGYTIFISCIAVLFKIMHFAGASWMVEMAIGSAVVLGIIKLFFSKGEKGE